MLLLLAAVGVFRVWMFLLCGICTAFCGYHCCCRSWLHSAEGVLVVKPDKAPRVLIGCVSDRVQRQPFTFFGPCVPGLLSSTYV